MISQRAFFLIIISILFGGSPFLKGQNIVTVQPQEYPEALSNPFKGFRPDPRRPKKDNYPTVVREYIKWNDVENHWSDGADKIIEHCNRLWAGFEEQNIKVAAQIYIDWDSREGNEYWPQDIVDELGWPTWDVRYWRSDLVKERIEKLIYKLGEAWDNDPRVAWVNTAIVGYWGEQENPVGVNEEGYVELMGEAFSKAFKNKKLVVRNQRYWDPKGYKWGVGWGSFAHPGQTSGSWTDIRRTTANGQYLTQIVEGEVAYNWGHNLFEPVMGSSPTITLGTDQYTNYLIDVIRELHATALGWVSGYRLDGTDNTDPAVVKANASKMQKAFGYRFVLHEFSTSPRANQGDSLKISFKVQNTGSAPFYYNWETAFVLIDELTHEIVWKEALPGVDSRDWHPGKNYNYNTRKYNVPAPVYEISKSLAVPDHLATGQYMAGITILEPFSGTPGVFFAVENFLKKSQTQPLCRIGIGEDLTGSHEVDASIFDDPLIDDARYYTLTPQGTTYSITGDTPNGSLRLLPKGGIYVPGTVVTVQAVGDLGYEFASWGGEFSDSEKSFTIVMDGDKSISAHFNEIPTYELTVNALNGSVSLYPEGGVYNKGTVVKMGYTADIGYTFSGWTGDITGTSRYIEVLMDSDKEITASFDFVGGPLVSFAINCGGPAYTAADGTVFMTDKNFSGGSVFSKNVSISGTDDDNLYQSERYGNMSYNFDLPNGIYEVTLMFAEIYHKEAGKRLFNVSIGGAPFITNLDIYKKAGANTAHNLTHTVVVGNGKLNISFQNIVNNAKISAIKVKPTYEGNAYDIDVYSSNGSVLIDPDGKTFMDGSIVTLLASPNGGYAFSEWSGDISGSENPITIIVDSNKSVAANFVETISFSLVTESKNGLISLNPPGGKYTEGTVVTLTPMPAVGYAFVAWGGDITGSETPATLTMDSDKFVTAEFKNPNQLFLTINSTNGSVRANPARDFYLRGASVVLTATPDEGYQFVAWEGNLSGSNNPVGFIMDSDKNITAVFSEKPTSIDGFVTNTTQTILKQNFPNPFSTETTIQYQLSKPSDVKLTVYDIMGQQVATLVDEHQVAGPHSVKWVSTDSKGGHLPNGLYMYRLETGNDVVQIRKMNLIK